MSTLDYLKIFAGLGLFFVGINFFSDHLKSHGKPYIRKIIKALTGTGLRAMASGALSGAVTNSAKAVTFSLAPIISSGLLTVSDALPIIIGASFGSALLVLWVSFDFKLMELALLGMAGLYYQFGDMKKNLTKFLAGLLLGLGLIFFGLDMLKSGAAALKESAGFMNFAASTHGYWLAALMIGAVTAFVTQSGSTMSIVAITFVSTGVLDFNQTVMFIYGTNIGSGISTAMLSFGLTGTGRQLVMFHAGIKLAGCLILVPALYLETYLGIPLMKAFAASMAEDPGAQIGIIYVAYEVVAGVFMVFMTEHSARILGRLWPPTHEETLSQARYLRNEEIYAVDDALLRRIAQEQSRILKRALRYFDSVRGDIPDRDKISFDTLYEANTSLQKEINQQLTKIATMEMDKKSSEEVLHRHSVNKWLEQLDECLFELARVLEKVRSSQEAAPLLDVIQKGLHAMLVAASKAMETDDAVKAHILIETTKNRVPMLRRVKPSALTPDLGLQKRLLGLIVSYERTIWVLISLAHSLARGDLPQSAAVSIDTARKGRAQASAPVQQAPADAARPAAAPAPRKRREVDYFASANNGAF